MPYDEMSRDEKQRLGALVIDLQTAMLVGGQAPIVAEMWERHKEPQPGDWVIEDSTLYALVYYPGRYPGRYNDDDLWDGQFCRYLRTVREWVACEEEPGGYWETFHVVETPDGSEFRWHNATMRAVPLTMPLAPSRAKDIEEGRARIAARQQVSPSGE